MKDLKFAIPDNVVEADERAHKDTEVACFTCHTSWTTSCAGCHLPIEANWKTERQHYEGGETRNFATYNPQVVRDQIFQIAWVDLCKPIHLGCRQQSSR